VVGYDRNDNIITLPLYSSLSITSGAMYAGVPTVDLGSEWNTEDCPK